MAEAVLTPRYKDLETGIWTRAAPLTIGMLERSSPKAKGKNRAGIESEMKSWGFLLAARGWNGFV